MSGLCLVLFCFLFLLSEVAPKAQSKSVAAALYNTMQIGDCKLLGVVRKLFWGTCYCLLGVRTHPVLLPNTTPLKLVRARIFVELPPAGEENWIKLSK